MLWAWASLGIELRDVPDFAEAGRGVASRMERVKHLRVHSRLHSLD
jgi:hypothetical protein